VLGSGGGDFFFVSFGQVGEYSEYGWLKVEVRFSSCIKALCCGLHNLFSKDVIKRLSFSLTDRHLLCR
jgi:hypothetical protein